MSSFLQLLTERSEGGGGSDLFEMHCSSGGHERQDTHDASPRAGKRRDSKKAAGRQMGIVCISSTALLCGGQLADIAWPPRLCNALPSIRSSPFLPSSSHLSIEGELPFMLPT